MTETNAQAIKRIDERQEKIAERVNHLTGWVKRLKNSLGFSILVLAGYLLISIFSWVISIW